MTSGSNMVEILDLFTGMMAPIYTSCHYRQPKLVKIIFQETQAIPTLIQRIAFIKTAKEIFGLALLLWLLSDIMENHLIGFQKTM